MYDDIQLLTVHQAAALYGHKRSSFLEGIKIGRFPKPEDTPFGKRWVYRNIRAHIEGMLNECKKEETAA